MDFELAMERIQAISGCRTQTELANVLGIKQSSISDAKRRRTIPDGWLVKLFRHYGANPSWILGEAEHPYLVEHLNRENPTTGIQAKPTYPSPKQDTRPTTRELLEALHEQLGDSFEVIIVPAGTQITLPIQAKTIIDPVDTNSLAQ